MIQELEGVRAGVGSSMQWIRVRGGITIAHVHGLWVAGTKDDTPERIEQSQNINAILNRMRGEKILIGDFNLNPDTKSIKLLEGNMRNLVREYGITTTRSELSKASKGKFADYAFVSAGVKLRKFSVLSAIVSDHLPLCLEIENPGGHSSRR
jgi:endonuclease/exonuclease/phosphatase (EEP) superfamily protein YafD